MSLGYLGRCIKVVEDDTTVVYSYTGENWNLPKDERDVLAGISGSFTIRKDALEEPEVHVKRVRRPNGRKVMQEKVILHTPRLGDHLSDGGIVIDELCGVDRKEFEETGFPLPRIARHLLSKVYRSYMVNRSLPEREAFIQ